MPRKQLTMDGNQAAAHVAYAYSDVAAIYPITPSTTMAELTDEWAEEERRNIFGQPVVVTQMQSEAGAAGTVHGSLAAGALTTTFTASQGLLLMIPNLYKLAGEMLPAVFHVAARTVATHALSIFGDHSDIYACRQTGAAILSSSSVQEVMDIAPVAHLAALHGNMPFIHFFDGFRTSHEMQKIKVWDYKVLEEMIDKDSVTRFRSNALHPSHGKVTGSAQNPDVYFQIREASNLHYNQLPDLVELYFRVINKRIGTHYSLFQYYGARDAEHIIIAMGSVCETIEETIDYLNEMGSKTGMIKVHLYRPFSTKYFLAAIPKSVKQITVLDRTKEPGSVGEPLYLDVCAALSNSSFHNIPIFSGRYGLSSKDTTPEQIHSVFQNHTKQRFTIGILDDVTNLSLPPSAPIYTSPANTICCKFWGLGGDGTVGANKNSVKIIGNNTQRYVQAYFDYDSKKTSGLTISHLRFGDEPIRSAYLIYQSDFVACHHCSYLQKYNVLEGLKEGGTFLLNCSWSPEEAEEKMPAKVKYYLANHHIHFFMIDASKISYEIGLPNKLNTILQAAFFKLVQVIPLEKVLYYMKESAKESYAKQGDEVIAKNYLGIERGFQDLVEIPIPKHWYTAYEEPVQTANTNYIEGVLNPINSLEGNSLPVSAFLPYANGSSPSGTSAYERRNIATEIPVWNPEHCIQCAFCSFVCPHAAIRPMIMNETEKKEAPTAMKSLPMMGMKDHEYAITISREDCTSCGSCANVCPGKFGKKALSMVPVHTVPNDQTHFDYGKRLPQKSEVLEQFPLSTIKGSQFRKPLLEFSGACAGCGETPYAKLVTQLFGPRMYIANATGCSSIWGNYFPATPYTTDADGNGPAWSNSLFEDAAEYGYGMLMAQKAIRNRLKEKVKELRHYLETKEAAEYFISTYQDGNSNQEATTQLIHTIKAEQHSDNTALSGICKELLIEKEFLSKKSQWVFGGDGWAYDIGFGGLDHVLASGEDINILVFDTEVYSNTGGQASKATPMGSSAKFAAGGKKTKKKDLARIAMTYGYVYVAQIAMGANFQHTLKTLLEAESYPGPSLVIAYAPCISHGIKGGLGNSKEEEKKAVESGHFHLFRYLPNEKKLVLDSKAPTLPYEDFLSGEIRYQSLRKKNNENAEILFQQASKEAKERYESLLGTIGN